MGVRELERARDNYRDLQVARERELEGARESQGEPESRKGAILITCFQINRQMDITSF